MTKPNVWKIREIERLGEKRSTINAHFGDPVKIRPKRPGGFKRPPRGKKQNRKISKKGGQCGPIRQDHH
jgi:hypothetical protein